MQDYLKVFNQPKLFNRQHNTCSEMIDVKNEYDFIHEMVSVGGCKFSRPLCVQAALQTDYMGAAVQICPTSCAQLMQLTFLCIFHGTCVKEQSKEREVEGRLSNKK